MTDDGLPELPSVDLTGVAAVIDGLDTRSLDLLGRHLFAAAHGILDGPAEVGRDRARRDRARRATADAAHRLGVAVFERRDRLTGAGRIMLDVARLEAGVGTVDELLEPHEGEQVTDCSETLRLLDDPAAYGWQVDGLDHPAGGPDDG